MFSGILLVVPLFKIITALGIYDTEMALIITMVTQTLPTAVFMLKSYFDTIPDEIEEAAMMDGPIVCKLSSVSPCRWRCRG